MCRVVPGGGTDRLVLSRGSGPSIATCRSCRWSRAIGGLYLEGGVRVVSASVVVLLVILYRVVPCCQGRVVFFVPGQEVSHQVSTLSGSVFVWCVGSVCGVVGGAYPRGCVRCMMGWMPVSVGGDYVVLGEGGQGADVGWGVWRLWTRGWAHRGGLGVMSLSCLGACSVSGGRGEVAGSGGDLGLPQSALLPNGESGPCGPFDGAPNPARLGRTSRRPGPVRRRRDVEGVFVCRARIGGDRQSGAESLVRVTGAVGVGSVIRAERFVRGVHGSGVVFRSGGGFCGRGVFAAVFGVGAWGRRDGWLCMGWILCRCRGLVP